MNSARSNVPATVAPAMKSPRPGDGGGDSCGSVNKSLRDLAVICCASLASSASQSSKRNLNLSGTDLRLPNDPLLFNSRLRLAASHPDLAATLEIAGDNP
jgi:hypothetical protein